MIQEVWIRISLQGWCRMEQEKKILSSIALMLVVAYGSSQAESGVSIPGCSESIP